MKRALVTGGAGFIGSHFLRRFLKTHPDWEVINYDKLTYAGNPANLRDFESNPRYHFVKGDICELKSLEKVCEGVSAIVHFAAETHVDRSIDDDQAFYLTNIWRTRHLLEMSTVSSDLSPSPSTSRSSPRPTVLNRYERSFLPCSRPCLQRNQPKLCASVPNGQAERRAKGVGRF